MCTNLSAVLFISGFADLSAVSEKQLLNLSALFFISRLKRFMRRFKNG
jgi:hypothetical protein